MTDCRTFVTLCGVSVRGFANNAFTSGLTSTPLMTCGSCVQCLLSQSLHVGVCIYGLRHDVFELDRA